MTTSVFKVRPEDRTRVREPKNLTAWVRNGFSEFIGTLMLSILLAGASVIAYQSTGANGTVVRTLGDYLINPAIDGLYAGFIAVGLVVIIFDRWSCDLNPSVTLYRMFAGKETYRYGVYKIVIQLVAGLVAGLLIYVTGIAINNGLAANRAIDMQDAISKIVPTNTNADAGGVWIFFLELMMTAVLLFPIFSPAINDKYRFILIFFVISMAVWGGVHGGSAALNPARGLAQQIPGLIWGPSAGAAASMTHVAGATGAMLAGTMLAPLFYLLVQDMTARYINPALTRIIRYKDLAEKTYVYIDQSQKGSPLTSRKRALSSSRISKKG